MDYLNATIEIKNITFKGLLLKTENYIFRISDNHLHA